MHRTLPMTRHLPLLALAIPLAGCPVAYDAPDPPPRQSQGECDDAWGPVPDDGRLYVDAAADSGGDGSLDRPFDTLRDAMDAALDGRARSVALAPGDYDGNLQFGDELQPGWQASGLDIVGCGTEETVLEADNTSPGIDILMADTSDVGIRNLAVTGGWRGIQVRGGAGSGGAILIENVLLEGPARVGLLVDGFETLVKVDGLVVRSPQADGDGYGWGVAIQTRAALFDDLPAPNSLQDVLIDGATECGLLADGAWVELTDVEVTDTRPAADGTLGRGVQLQRRTAGVITGLTSEGNADAAIHLHKPGRGDDAVEILDSTLRGTVASGDADAADGISASQEGDGQDPASFLVIVDGTSFEANVRSHLLVEDVTIEVGPDSLFGKGTAHPVVTQGEGLVTGLDGGAAPVTSEALSADQALELHRPPLDLDAGG